MTRRGGRYVVAVLLAACAAPPGPLPEAERAVVVGEVEAMQSAFQAAITNLDVDAYLGFLAPPVEFRFARDGVLVRGIHDEVRQQFALVDSLSCDWPDHTVTVLTREVATVTTTYRCEGRNKDGATWEGGGAWTNVLQRRLDRWVIVEAHESHVPPEVR